MSSSQQEAVWSAAKEVPYAHYLFEAVEIYIMLIGEWGDKSLERALEKVQHALREIAERLEVLHNRTNDLNQRMGKLENTVTVIRLKDMNREAKGYAFDVSQGFDDPRLRSSVAYKAGLLADAFVNEVEPCSGPMSELPDRSIHTAN